MSIEKKISNYELIEILDPYMIPTFDMIYDSYKVNHLAEGAIALQTIGASKERIKEFIQNYILHLEKPKQEDLNAPPIEPEKCLGTDNNFYPMLKYFEKVFQYKYNGDLDLFTAESYIALYKGIVSKVLHGVLEIGYGYFINYPRMIFEGLALTHTQFLTPKNVSDNDYAKIGLGHDSFEDVLNKIAADIELRKLMLSQKDLNVSIAFASKIRTLIENRSMKILDYAQSINLPYKDIENKDKFEKVLIWLIQYSMYIYANSELKNDFFLLHGLTGAWALTEVARLIYTKIGVSKALLVVQSYIYVLITIYIAEYAPKIITNKEAFNEYKNSDQPGIPVEWECNENDPLWLQNLNWKIIIKRAMTNDDVHILKIVQVALKTFELVGKDQSLCYLCERVANLVLTRKFTRGLFF